MERKARDRRDEIAAVVEGLLRSVALIVENAPGAYRALAVYRASASAKFADAPIAYEEKHARLLVETVA